ncbi:MAG: outer membrane lipoprotein chaperone LolA [Campylobacteraceae bacterium]|nr:outer membrane lipoprotein chaperone LolA [Campylobacteraceae bacterium]
MKKTILKLAFILPCFVFANELEFKTLKSNFVQTVTSDGSKIEYSGNFMTTHNNAFWHYKSPTVKNIYFNYERVAIIEPDLEQVIYTSLTNVPNLIDVIKSATKVSKDTYQAELDTITYTLTLKDGLMSEISYKDRLDNDVVIKFSDVRKNEYIDDSLLLPVYPKEYDVVVQ